jgi:hypothetical protein
METVVPAVIIIALLLLATFTISAQFLSSQEAVMDSWRELQGQMEERNMTRLTPVQAQTTVLGDAVEITVRNDGSTKLTDFDRWDVILTYTGSDGFLHTEWYPFGTGENEWIGVLDELYEPGILNPGEEMVIEVAVSPSVASSTTNVATVTTPNGLSATTVFAH